MDGFGRATEVHAAADELLYIEGSVLVDVDHPEELEGPGGLRRTRQPP